MIASIAEYKRVQADLYSLEARLAKLKERRPFGDNEFTMASVRKLIARLQEELVLFEGNQGRD